MPKFRTDILIASLFAAVWLAFGFSTIRHYGVMNDAPIKYASGFRNYYFAVTGDKAYLDPKNTPELAEGQGLLHEHWFLKVQSFQSVDYAPLFDALSFFACDVLHRKLNVLNFFDAHNSVVIVLFSAFVGCVYLFSAFLHGRPAGVLAALFFGLFPRLIAHAHNNLSDVPLMFFFFATAAVFHWAVVKENPYGLVASIGLFGMAVAAKLNGVFLVFILLPWRLAHKYLNRKKFSKAEKWTWAVSPLIAYFFWVANFPYFWTAPSLGEFFSRQINSHIFTMLTQEKIVGYEGGWNLSVFFQALATTPTVCLVFLAPGFAVSLRDLIVKRDSRFVLLFLWLFVPIFKSSLPGIKNYEMIRHFMEYIPALAVFSSLGVLWVYRAILSIPAVFRFRKPLAVCGTVLILGSLATPIYQIHPYETLFFNRPVGGLPGAKRHFMYAYDYWQTSLRSAIEWTNANGRENAEVAAVGYYDYNVMEPALLRKDLRKVSLRAKAVPMELSLPDGTVLRGTLNKYDYSGYILMLANDLDRSDFKMFLDVDPSLKPLRVFEVDGAEVAKIFYVDRSFGIMHLPGKAYIFHFDRENKVRNTMIVEKVSPERHY
ncbi:MAG: glycosyltransferase family 39 protein [Nitrospinae bacterium]|nr:glycosyltransferase family 39 protein [Nitrospinota bacterium]